jgi:oligopeptide/dipeptide ABC transporter ATP-binding protein
MKTTPKTNQLLEATKVSVSTFSQEGMKELLHEISFNVCQKEVLIFLGESGSGKTILSRSLTRLFPVTSTLKLTGSVTLDGQRLWELDESELSLIRRHRIRYVFQEPMQSLNPLAKIRTQMRLTVDTPSKDEKILHDNLRLVGLDNSEEILDLYPHELSIGMAQRVCIAMAVLPCPDLLIADEPTSAVDGSLRHRLLELLISIQRRTTMSLILITHDLDAAHSYGDRIIVMHGGRIIESAASKAFFEAPLHPYSRQLVNARIHTTPSTPILDPIISEIPQRGCLFWPRCPIAKDKCKVLEPELDQVSGEREVRCHYWK